MVDSRVDISSAVLRWIAKLSGGVVNRASFWVVGQIFMSCGKMEHVLVPGRPRPGPHRPHVGRSLPEE